VLCPTRATSWARTPGPEITSPRGGAKEVPATTSAASACSSRPRRGPGPAVTLVSGARTKGCGNSQTDVDHHVSDHPRATGTGMADRLPQQPVMRPNRRPDTHATCTTTLRAEPALMRRLNPPRFAAGKPPTARWCRVGDLAAAEVDRTAGRMLRPHLPEPNDHVHLRIKMRRRNALNSGTRLPRS
jgi:hypothetical protein